MNTLPIPVVKRTLVLRAQVFRSEEVPFSTSLKARWIDFADRVVLHVRVEIEPSRPANRVPGNEPPHGRIIVPVPQQVQANRVLRLPLVPPPAGKLEFRQVRRVQVLLVVQLSP